MADLPEEQHEAVIDLVGYPNGKRAVGGAKSPRAPLLERGVGVRESDANVRAA